MVATRGGNDDEEEAAAATAVSPSRDEPPARAALELPVRSRPRARDCLFFTGCFCWSVRQWSVAGACGWRVGLVGGRLDADEVTTTTEGGGADGKMSLLFELGRNEHARTRSPTSAAAATRSQVNNHRRCVSSAANNPRSTKKGGRRKAPPHRHGPKNASSSLNMYVLCDVVTGNDAGRACVPARAAVTVWHVRCARVGVTV